jgi:large subunit GTPase 1
MVADDGTPLDGSKIRLATTLARTDVRMEKKHHKKGKRVKQRSGQGYE